MTRVELFGGPFDGQDREMDLVRWLVIPISLFNRARYERVALDVAVYVGDE